MRNLKFYGGLALVVACSLLLALFYVMRTEQPPSHPQKPPAAAGKEADRRDALRDVAPPRQDEGVHKPLSAAYTVAIVIDDIGQDMTVLDELLALDAPLTFAVLPRLPHSVDAARAVHRAGKEVLLHLPMEPRGYPSQKPGAGALFITMSDDEVRRTVDDDIASVPYVSGVNNHMGSRFMEDEGKLSLVFAEIKARGYFFLDSRTTPLSKAGDLAARMHMPYAERQVFIDNVGTFQQALDQLLSAGKRGVSVVLIGHPHPATIRALKEALPLMKARGVAVVSASECVHGAGRNGGTGKIVMNNAQRPETGAYR